MDRSLMVGTKCSIPRTPELLVRRPRLEQMLASGQRRPVTLISATPGAGKTTLVTSSLAGAAVGPVAWVTLDRRDDEPGRLANLVVAALVRAGMVEGFDTSVGDGDDLHDALFEHLVRQGRRAVLVLDDAHEVTSHAALGTLDRLLHQAPPVLDLVVVARADPPVRWGSLEVDGRLCQVRSADLRFDTGEADQLLRRHGIDLSRDETHALCDRTEGWAAGLRLAARALQRDPEPGAFVLSASATQVAVSDYLLTEVLDREADGARQFLLRTSVVDRLTPDLAATLSDDRHAAQRLRSLERRGIFLVELDDDGSYRYHALFAALLRARLRLGDPELFVELHRRAAHWHLDHELAYEAEHHARLAGDWRLVGRLAQRRWLAATLGGAPPGTGGPSPADVPVAAAMAVPELALVAAAAACRRGDRTEADAYRDVVDHAAADGHGRAADGHGGAGDGEGPGSADDPTGHVARLVLDLEHGRAFGASPRALRAAHLLFDGAGANGWAPGARRLATIRAAELDLGAGQLRRARSGLAAVAADPGAGPLRAEALALGGLVDAVAGRLADAEAASATVLAEAQPRTAPVAVAHLALAYAHAQRGDHRAAAQALATAGPPSPASHAVCALDELARAVGRHRSPHPPALAPAAVDQSLTVAALTALGVTDVVDPHGYRRANPAPGMRCVASCRRQVAGLPSGPEAAAVEAWLDAVGAGDRGTNGTNGHGPLGEGGWVHPRTRIEANLLASIVAGEAGDEALADRRLDTALGLLGETGIRAPFDDHAGRLATRLRRLATERGEHAGLAVALVDRLQDGGNALLVEELTDRELEVLRRLPTLMSNGEIAAGMHVSVNTVKTHLKAVYRKLGVAGRRQAVLRGREQQLI